MNLCKKDDTIGIIILATNKYATMGINFVKRFKRFYTGSAKIKFYFVSDVSIERMFPDDVDITHIEYSNQKWIDATNSKFEHMLKLSDEDLDWLFYVDADTSVSQNFDESWFCIGDRVGNEHFMNDQWLKNYEFSFDTNPKSKAYIEIDKTKQYNYYHACLFGGRKDHIIKMCTELMEWQSIDKNINYEPRWNDESYVNKYFDTYGCEMITVKSNKFHTSTKGGVQNARHCEKMSMREAELLRFYKDDLTVKISGGEIVFDDMSEFDKAYENTEFADFNTFKNKHCGETAILFGSGPTVKQYDDSKVNKNIIRIGSNEFVHNKDVKLDYYFIGDAGYKSRGYNSDRKTYNEYVPAMEKFIRKRYDTSKYPNMPLGIENAKYYSIKKLAFYPKDKTKILTTDISTGMHDVGSISFEALQFALYCGIKRIILVGHDCSYDKGTFNTAKVDKGSHSWMSVIVKNWKTIKHYVEENYPDVHIQIVNPVGLVDVYDEIQLSNIEEFYNETDKSFITGATKVDEHLVMWWVRQHRKFHPKAKLTVCDFGNMSPDIRKWVSSNVDFFIDYTNSSKMPLRNKAKAMLDNPYKQTCWMNLNCEIKKSFEDVFDGMKDDSMSAPLDPGRPGDDWFSTGLIAINGKPSALKDWSEFTITNRHVADDQNAFQSLLNNRPDIRENIATLKQEYQWMRVLLERNKDSDDKRTVLWTGPVGTEYIKNNFLK